MYTLRIKSLATSCSVVDHFHLTLIIDVTEFALYVALFIPRLHPETSVSRFESVRVRSVIIQRIDLLQNGYMRGSRHVV